MDRSRFLAIAIVVFGVLLLLPSLWTGFMLDDYIYQAALDGSLYHMVPSDYLFDFFSGDEEVTSDLAHRGLVPWWTSDGLRMVFFRPLSDWLMRFDRAVFGRDAFWHHVHSLVWWAALLAAASLILRRSLSSPIAILALLLFAVDESRFMPAVWISNRNALVALAPAFFGLWAHIRWREEGWRPGRVLAPTCLAIGLLGGETAIAVVAYLVAYEIFGRTEDLRERALSLLPFAGVAAAYIVGYQSFGFGVSGSGVYIDPLSDPGRFAVASITRIPALLAGGISAFPADLWIMAPRLRSVQVGVGFAAVSILVALFIWSWRFLDQQTRRGIRWLVPGSALAMVPFVSTYPSDRLFLAPALGLCAVIAAVIHSAWLGRRERDRRLLAAAGAVLFAVHLVIVPLFGLAAQAAVLYQARAWDALARTVDVGTSEEDLVIITAPDHVVAVYLPLIVHHLGRPLSRGWRVLSLAPFDHRVTRIDSNTLDLEVVGGAMMGTVFELLYRSESDRLLPGMALDRGVLKAEILAGNEDGPTLVRFIFDRDLDDSSLRLAVWRNGTLARIAPPAIGETLTIPKTPGPAGF